MALTDPDAVALAKSLAHAMNVSFEQIEAWIEARRAKDRQRLARHNAKWEAWLRLISDAQELRRFERERNGYRLFHMRRMGQRVALVMQKDKVWNSEKGRMGTKLAVIYPDGSSAETFERSISVRPSF